MWMIIANIVHILIHINNNNKQNNQMHIDYMNDNLGLNLLIDFDQLSQGWSGISALTAPKVSRSNSFRVRLDFIHWQ